MLSLVTIKQLNFSERVSKGPDKISGNPRICPVNTEFWPNIVRWPVVSCSPACRWDDSIGVSAYRWSDNLKKTPCWTNLPLLIFLLSTPCFSCFGIFNCFWRLVVKADKYKQKQYNINEKKYSIITLSFQSCTVTKQSIMLSPYFLPAKSELRFASELEESLREITLIHTKIRNTYWISHDWDSIWNRGEQKHADTTSFP